MEPKDKPAKKERLKHPILVFCAMGYLWDLLRTWMLPPESRQSTDLIGIFRVAKAFFESNTVLWVLGAMLLATLLVSYVWIRGLKRQIRDLGKQLGNCRDREDPNRVIGSRASIRARIQLQHEQQLAVPENVRPSVSGTRYTQEKEADDDV